MNKLLDFVQGGATKLPPGFRFQPTEEEIVFEYLIKKTFSHPLPASVVPQITIYKTDPWDFPGDEEQDKYFFTKKEAKYQIGNRMNRTTKSGYWKATGSDKKIKCPRKSRERDSITGMRKTLVFHTGKSPNGYRTGWVMHEYRLVNSSENIVNSSIHNNSTLTQNYVQVGEWFLCHVFLRKQGIMVDDASQDENVYNLMRLDTDDTEPSTSSFSSSSSSCGSSSITDITSVKKNRRSHYTKEFE